MYGLEKKPGDKFAFDLEKKIKETPTHGKELLDRAQLRMSELKKQLREGASEKDFDKLGVLLHGYAALQRVLKKIAK